MFVCFCYLSAYFCFFHFITNAAAAISTLASVFVDYSKSIPWSLLLTKFQPHMVASDLKVIAIITGIT